MKIQRISSDEFWAKYDSLACPLENPTAEILSQIESEFGVLSEEIHGALKKHFSENDYELSSEPQPCWHHCMGLYSTAIHSKVFISDILEALQCVSGPWCFHVACECEHLGDGQIFFYDGNIFGDDSGNLDYSVFNKKHPKINTPAKDQQAGRFIDPCPLNYQMVVEEVFPIGDDEVIVFGVTKGFPSIKDQLQIIHDNGKTQIVTITQFHDELEWDGKDWNVKTGARRGLGLTTSNDAIPVPGDVLRSINSV